MFPHVDRCICHYCQEIVDGKYSQQLFVPSYGSCYICDNCTNVYYQEKKDELDQRGE